jgi:putative dimethyl sulfoxide reductase chaperone
MEVPMEPDELQMLMKARQNVYDLLRCLFLTDPSLEFLRALKQDNFLENLRGYHPELDEGISLFSSALSLPDIHLRVSELSQEFTRLFIGPTPIPLYESVYRSPNGLVMQEETIRVLEKYMKAGLAINPTQSFPADHIGAELEFLFFLCKKGAKEEAPRKRDANLKLQEEFLREHLNLWAGSLCDRLFQEAESPYFRGLAKMTKGFIAWDYEEIVSNFFEEIEDTQSR